MKEKKYNYQLVLVLNPKTEEKENVFKKVSAWLESHSVEIEKKDHMGLKELVYEIKDCKSGDFWILDLVSSTTIKLNELNVLLNRENNIIRYLILKKE